MSAGTTTAPVTVIVTRRVRHGRAAEFERLMSGMQAAAARFPGHRGGFLIPPDAPEQGCYRTLFAFDNEAHLQAWTHSAERNEWLERIAAVTHGDSALRVLTGLETWFALPATRTKAPPPRWKMALVTWSGIFPLVLLSSLTVSPLFGPWLHPTLVVLLATGLIVTAMTFVMPTLVRLLVGWLYPAERDT
jgi:antibiotic biosynthesis monooxygenase (ABM) superfamily enzyme